MKEPLEIFSTAKVCMDTYKDKYSKAKSKKEERYKNLNVNYKPGSPMFIQERDEITPEYEKEVEHAKNETLGHFEDILMRTMAHEKAAVSVVSGSTKEMLATLQYLEDMPVSLDEYNALTESFGGKLYWVDRFFERIADKNGIAKTGVQPSLTVKLEILETLAQNVREFISDYDGEKKTFPVTSSDKYIYALEDRFTNGYSGVHMDSKEQAKRMVSKALGKGDSLERSCTLANMLRTATPDMQNEILSVLSESDSSALSDPTMSLTGVRNMLDRFEKENGKLMKSAEKAMESVKSAKTHKERIGIIYDNLDNRHFAKEIESYISDTKDRELLESYKNMQVVKREEKEQ